MASSNLNLSVVLRAVNHLSGPARTAMRSLEDVNRVAAQSKGLRQMAADFKAVGEGMQKFGALAMGAGVAGAAALGLTSVPGQAVQAEHSLRRVGNIAGLTTEQLRGANQELYQLAGQVNQYQKDLIGGLDMLIAGGLNFGDAMKSLPAVGKAATAYSVELGTLAATSADAMRKLKIVPEEIQGMLGVAAEVGEQGVFTFKDMAEQLSSVTGQAQFLGLKGVPAVAQLGAALQVAADTAGNATEAGDSLRAFFGLLTSEAVVKNFAGMGVDLEYEFQRAAKSGDPLLHVLRLIERETKGDPFKLKQLFGGEKVNTFLKPMINNLDRYVEVRDKALEKGGSSELIDKNFRAMMDTIWEQMKLIRNNAAAIFGPMLTRQLAGLNQVLTAINSNPALLKLAVYASLATVAFGGLLVGTGTFIRLGGSTIRTVSAVRGGLSALLAGTRGATTGLEGGQLVMGKFGGVLRSVTLGMRAFNFSLLANPVGLVIAGVVAALAVIGLLVYKYWAPISGFFRGLWQGIKAGVEPIKPALEAIIEPFRPLGALIGKVIGWFKGILKPVDDVGGAAEAMGVRIGTVIGGIITFVAGLPGKFYEAGMNIMTSLWEGMKNLAGKPVELIKNVVQKIRDFLPFSPAKEGPLRDLHRVRIIETIADGMQPGPMVGAMRAAATAALAVAPMAAPLPAFGAPSAAGTRAAAAPVVHVHYAPVYHIGAGADPDIVRQLKELDAVQKAELQRFFARVVRQEQETRARTANGWRDE